MSNYTDRPLGLPQTRRNKLLGLALPHQKHSRAPGSEEHQGIPEGQLEQSKHLIMSNNPSLTRHITWILRRDIRPIIRLWCWSILCTTFSIIYTWRKTLQDRTNTSSATWKSHTSNLIDQANALVSRNMTSPDFITPCVIVVHVQFHPKNLAIRLK